MYTEDRIELKRRAKGIMSSSKPSPVSVGVVYLLVTGVFSLLSTRLLGANLSENDVAQIMNHMNSGNYEYAMLYMQGFMPPTSAYLIDFALNIVSYILSTGFVLFLLNTIRNTGACYGNLLDGFGFFWRVIVLQILSGIFIFLWSLLLVVPGIIAAYRYRQAIYILIDHPEMSVLECISESKRLMKGHKWELFVLDLSFIGWMILSAPPVLGLFVSIYTTPYTGLTYALYYEALCGRVYAQQNEYSDPRNFG